ncbi:hypothetical protein ACLOJK_012240 [Asimina triloba]
MSWPATGPMKNKPTGMGHSAATSRAIQLVEVGSSFFFFCFVCFVCFGALHLTMDPESARNAKEQLELVFKMSNILETGLDRQTLSILMALCDRGFNPEALAALVKELRSDAPPPSPSPPLPNHQNHP